MEGFRGGGRDAPGSQPEVGAVLIVIHAMVVVGVVMTAGTNFI